MITLNIISYSCACGYYQDSPGDVCPSCGGQLAKGESKCRINIAEQGDMDVAIKALQSEPLRDIPTGKVRRFADPLTMEVGDVPQTRKETQAERDAEIAQVQSSVLLEAKEIEALRALLVDGGKSEVKRTEDLKLHKNTLKSLREKGHLAKDVWY